MTLKQTLITTLTHLVQAHPEQYKTDKYTEHSYLELYDLLLAPYCMNTGTKLLEIGVGKGGSIKLWNDYFDDAYIFGIEREADDDVANLCGAEDRITVFQKTDAYSRETVQTLWTADLRFDVIIDDGSHQPVHQAFVISDYLPLLKPEGTMIIEDVVSLPIAAQIVSQTRAALGKDDRVAIFDRSNVKGVEDDIVIVIKKGR